MGCQKSKVVVIYIIDGVEALLCWPTPYENRQKRISNAKKGDWM
jgi:hypothetical protein